MKSKEVEEAINKTKQLKQFIKERGKDFCFYDNENAVIGYECLKTALNYIEELETKNAMQEYRINEMDIPKQVIRDKITEYRNKRKTIYFGFDSEKKSIQQLIDEKIIEVLSEILGEEEK